MIAAGLLREYGEHLRLRKERVTALFGAPPAIEACPLEAGYRTQAKFFVRWSGARPEVTGIDPRFGEVPWPEVLWMLPGRGRAMLAAVVRTLDERTPPGLVTGLELRLEHGGGGGHLTLAIPRGPARVPEDFYSEFLEAVPGLSGLAAPSQSIERGAVFLVHAFGGHVLEAHHRAFFQANEPLLPLFVETVQSAASGSDTDRILDLYCGAGLHSLPAAADSAGSTVLGIDNNRRAIESARRNTERHGIEGRAEFRCESVENHRGPAVGNDEDVSLVFVNPSRSGCGPGVVESIVGRCPPAVVLVSCSPESHRRDIDDFERIGYRAVSLRCFDMFPFTDFLESVTRLERVG